MKRTQWRCDVSYRYVLVAVLVLGCLLLAAMPPSYSSWTSDWNSLRKTKTSAPLHTSTSLPPKEDAPPLQTLIEVDHHGPRNPPTLSPLVDQTKQVKENAIKDVARKDETEKGTEAGTETEKGTEAVTETEKGTEAVTETEKGTEAGSEKDPPIQLFGIGPKYVNMNTHNDIVARRRKRMSAVEQIKAGPCSGFEEHAKLLPRNILASFNFSAPATIPLKEDEIVKSANWETFASNYFVYLKTGADFALEYFHDQGKGPTVLRSVCEAAHPWREGVQVVIDRIGPFTSHGNYDWNSMIPQANNNFGNLDKKTFEKDIHLVGGMLAPVFENGTIVGFPPLHIHHAHLYPYANFSERVEKIRGSAMDSHDIVFQSHGDSECFAQHGGTDCLLHELEEDEGFFMNSKSGLSFDFDINDLRPKGSPPLQFYMDIVVMYKEGMPKKNATFVGLNNPCIGPGPCTYANPLDSNGTMVYYNYTHKHLGSGVMKNFVFHSHHTLVDSAFLIKGKQVEAFLESFMEGFPMLPVIIECHNGGALDLQQMKMKLMSEILDPGNKDVELVCELTRPGLLKKCDNDGACEDFDKRGNLNCLESVRMEQGDVLTVIAFNSIHTNFDRNSSLFKERNAFGPEYFSAFQHSIFRFDFITDPGYGYAPPSFFHYGEVPRRYDRGQEFVSNASCSRPINFFMNREKNILNSNLYL